MTIDEGAAEAAFRRWCADELVDPRLEDILEEAFINGWIACAVEADATLVAATSTRALKQSLRGAHL